MSQFNRMAPRLAANWDRVADQVQSSRRIAVLLDFDGTLVNIARRPDLVRLTPSTRQALRRLAHHHPRVTLAVISGRRRAELIRYIGIRGLRYMGLYGWERSRHSPLPTSALRALQRARVEFSTHLSSIPGIWMEDKKFSLSVHLLDVPPTWQRRARLKLRSMLLPFQRTLRIIENLRDTEVVPRCISGKGTAVQQLLAKPPLDDAFPFYFGDDLSDEPAFDSVRRGISVCVGDARPTRARYSVRTPAEVTSILKKLEAALQ